MTREIAICGGRGSGRTTTIINIALSLSGRTLFLAQNSSSYVATISRINAAVMNSNSSWIKGGGVWTRPSLGVGKYDVLSVSYVCQDITDAHYGHYLDNLVIDSDDPYIADVMMNSRYTFDNLYYTRLMDGG